MARTLDVGHYRRARWRSHCYHHMGVPMNDLAHWLVTAALGLFSLLLTGFAFVLWTNFRDVKSKTDDLTRQNESQERELATLKANHVNHTDGMAEVKVMLREVREAINQLSLRMGYRATPYTGGESGRKT